MTRCLLVMTVLALISVACGGTPEETQPQPRAPEAKTRSVTAPAGDPHWGYEGAEGPDAWGTLSPKWAVCAEGTRQSPIDIPQTIASRLPVMTSNFSPAALKIIHQEHMADVVNSGHSIQVNYTEGDELTVGDERFELLQYHFHGPSEHTIGGKRYPMEMHMVHRSAEGKLAVVGVLIEEGQHNAAFDPVWSNLPHTRSTEHHLEHVMVDVNALLPASHTTYRYEGSLTTPPCTEGVQWLVMATPIQLSVEQVGAFLAIMKGNSRPVQPLNGRPVVTDYVAESEAR